MQGYRSAFRRRLQSRTQKLFSYLVLFLGGNLRGRKSEEQGSYDKGNLHGMTIFSLTALGAQQNMTLGETRAPHTSMRTPQDALDTTGRQIMQIMQINQSSSRPRRATDIHWGDRLNTIMLDNEPLARDVQTWCSRCKLHANKTYLQTMRSVKLRFLPFYVPFDRFASHGFVGAMNRRNIITGSTLLDDVIAFLGASSFASV